MSGYGTDDFLRYVAKLSKCAVKIPLEDEDGYIPPGPDPQTVDAELMALLEPGHEPAS